MLVELAGQLGGRRLLGDTGVAADVRHEDGDLELLGLTDTVTDYNAFISTQATARSAATGRPWVYVDVNALLAALPPGSIPAFPNTPPRPTSVTAPFGAFFSFDGIHPSAVTHKAIANALIQTINGYFGTSLQQIP